MLYHFVGAGKGMFHAFDDTWRWRFRAGDKYFGRFWVQTVRFLARSKLVGPATGRGPDRPQALPARTADPASGPLSQSRTGPDQRRRHRPGRKTRARGPRKLALKLVPGTRNVFEGALPQATEGEYEVRLLPAPDP